MSYIVYQFLNNHEKVIYIGKTTQGLNKRVFQHKRDKKWFSEVQKIKYINCQDKLEMDIFERFYISKLKPKYNIVDTQYNIPNINCHHDKWEEYKESSPRLKSHKSNKRKLLKFSKEDCLHILKLRFEDMKTPVEIANIMNQKDLNFVYYICHNYGYCQFTKEYINKLKKEGKYCSLTEWNIRKYRSEAC